MLNSAGTWEIQPAPKTVPLGDLWIRQPEPAENRWVRAIKQPCTFDQLGFGNLCKLKDGYGREVPVAMLRDDGRLMPVKWVRQKLRAEAARDELRNPVRRRRPRRGSRSDEQAEQGTPGQAPFSREILESHLPGWVAPGRVHELVQRGNGLVVRIDFSHLPATAFIDSRGRALADPLTKEDLPRCCRDCSQLEECRAASPAGSTAFAWRQLGLIEPDGTPTQRGAIFGFFNAGEGLAVAAALEDESYPIDELLFDLANLRAGPRFAGDDEPVLGGRLGSLCQRVYARADQPGYLEMGVPVGYGAGASEVVRDLVEHPGTRHRLVNEQLRQGDIERAVAEWIGLLRHIALAPPFDLPRWAALQTAARGRVESVVSPNQLDFPPLLAAQARRYASPALRR